MLAMQMGYNNGDSGKEIRFMIEMACAAFMKYKKVLNKKRLHNSHIPCALCEIQWVSCIVLSSYNLEFGSEQSLKI